MSTMPKPRTTGAAFTGVASHTFHAEAYVLSGHIEQPIDREILRQALVELNNERGGDFFERVGSFQVDGAISFESGNTEVSGSRDPETQAWVTVATATIEGLHPADSIVVDRAVAKVRTEHPVEHGHVPFVSFAGTTFGNLWLGGNPVEVDFDLEICGTRPEGDRLYTEDLEFLDRVEKQVASIAHAFGLPSELKAEYDKELSYIKQLKQRIRGGQGSWPAGTELPKVRCSLVKSIAPIPGVKIFGNILDIQGVGFVSLGELEVGERLYKSEERPSNYFKVTMIAKKHSKHGKTHGPTASANGIHHP